MSTTAPISLKRPREEETDKAKYAFRGYSQYPGQIGNLLQSVFYPGQDRMIYTQSESEWKERRLVSWFYVTDTSN